MFMTAFRDKPSMSHFVIILCLCKPCISANPLGISQASLLSLLNPLGNKPRMSSFVIKSLQDKPYPLIIVVVFAVLVVVIICVVVVNIVAVFVEWGN